MATTNTFCFSKPPLFLMTPVILSVHISYHIVSVALILMICLCNKFEVIKIVSPTIIGRGMGETQIWFGHGCAAQTSKPTHIYKDPFG